MAIQTMPSTPAVQAIKMRSVQRTKSTQADSGKIISRRYGGQLFEATLVFAPMTRDSFAPISTFLTKQSGKNGIFYIRLDPMRSSAGALAGNYVNFANLEKLYLLTDDSATSEYPVKPISAGIINTTDVHMRCSLKSDVHEVNLGKDGLVRFEIDVVERLI